MKESEDNLENFFRNRAEGNQYEFEESDWAKMEAKLDAEMPVVSPFPYSKYKWMGLGAVITAVLFIGYIQFTEWDSLESNSIVLNMPEAPIENEGVPPEVGIIEPAKSSSNSSVNIKNEPIDHPMFANDENSVNSADLSNQQTIITNNNPKLFSNNKITETNDRSTTLYSSSGLVPTNPVFMAKPYKDEEKEITKIKLDTKVKKVSYEFADVNLPNPSIFKTQKTTPLEPKYQRIYTLSLLAGVDVSSTNESEWGSPVVRLGVAGEYYIGKRWSIGVGANLSNKKYQAKGTEYSPPKGFWTNGIVPDSTNAVCQVLDVPVSVNYFQPINNKSNLLVSTGLSSWFMLKEDYWYKYKSNDPNLVSWWGGENENRYWFSVINLSMAYEYRLTNKWSIAVGPYLNIPLSGVGHGKVELQSFGLKGALRFNKFKLAKF